MNTERDTSYLHILEDELIPALGCTEPTAVALASAKACAVLGSFPSTLEVACSGDIVKNVAGVLVPASGGHKGIRAAAILGALGGDADRELQVLETVNDKDRARLAQLLATNYCITQVIDDAANLLIRVTAHDNNGRQAFVEIKDSHTHFSRIEYDGEVLLDDAQETHAAREEQSALTIAGILEFARSVDTNEVRALLDRQIEMNEAIAREGLRQDYGVRVGKTLIAEHTADVARRARALAAAGSDARMSGCMLPVVINSGSGNQGLTASVPVCEYAREQGVTQERLYRALIMSNLIAIHIKSHLGKLSAFCGVVCAACGSGAAITWLAGGDQAAIEHTITNTLATIGGMFCDGAKPSCAAKIASSLDAALLASELALTDQNFQPGEGLVQDDIEATIDAFGRLGRNAMHPADEEIVRLMVKSSAIG